MLLPEISWPGPWRAVISLVESQKGIITIQFRSVENQKVVLQLQLRKKPTFHLSIYKCHAELIKVQFPQNKERFHARADSKSQ